MSFLRPYFKGATPKRKPPKEQEDGNSAKNKKYESKRTRKFQESWKANRPWLCFDPVSLKLSCSTCKKHFPSDENAYVKGTTYLRLDGIKAHESSECHQKSVAREHADNTPIHQSQATKSLTALKKADHDKLVIKMRNAHACAKHSLSFKTYEVMCRLDKMKTLELGSQYCTDKAGATFCRSIAKVTRSDVVTKIENCSWCSISCDGSTDFTGEDMEAVYVRTCSKGKIEDSFLHLGSSESSCSEDIFNFLMKTLQTMNVEDTVKKKLVGFCADGASNMQGLNKGVAALLKQRWPYIIVTHCLVHRLELGFKDAVKKASPKLHDKATTLLLGLYYLFRKSPKEKKGLLRTFETLGEKQLLPTRIGGTRWLPHYMRAINIFLRTYKVLRFHLETSSHKNAKAEGLARILCDGHVIAYIIAMKRVVNNLQNLSLYLQQDKISIADAYTRVETAKITLSQLLNKEDTSVSAVLENESFSGEHVVFKGQKPSSTLVNSTIQELLKALDNRFPTSELISATLVSSFKNWPHLKEDELTDLQYGDKEVTVLYEHFSPVIFPDVLVTVDDVTDEWSTLRTLIYKKYPDRTSLQWQHVMSDLSDQNLEHIFKLVEVLLALPPTSVKCETAFSAMKLLKTKRRGRLANDRLNDLMTIKIMSPSIEEFDPEPAIVDWMMSTPSGQKRRIGERLEKSSRTVIISDNDDSVSDAEPEVVQTLSTIQTQPVAQSTMKMPVIDNYLDGDSDSDDEPDMSEDLVFFRLMDYSRE